MNNVSDFIEIEPNTREGVMMAYSRGLITYETMREKLLELDTFKCFWCKERYPRRNFGYVAHYGVVCEFCEAHD